MHIPSESFKLYCIAVCILGLYKFSKRFKNFFEMAPLTSSATHEQIDTLLNFLDEHKDLARGLLRGAEGKLRAKRLWEELCNMLNSMGGCTKAVHQWQRVWSDRKHLAKKAAADSRRSASATGGGPSMAPPLSYWELKILSIMGEGFGGRQTGAITPAFSEPPLRQSETNEPIASTSSHTSPPPSFSQPLALHEEAVDRQPEPATQPRRSQASLTSTLSSQPTRPRRHSAAGSDVRSRLYQYEEGRGEREIVRNTELASIRAELAGIKAALLQLCSIIENHLELRP